MKISYEEVSKRAYNIWVQEGKPKDRELEHWLQAEQEVRNKNGKSNRRVRTQQSVTP